MPYTEMRGSPCGTMFAVRRLVRRGSSRVLKLFAHGLSYTPSPGQANVGIWSLDLMSPPGAVTAASNWVFAVAAATFTRRIAWRARSELENRCHDTGSPP